MTNQIPPPPSAGSAATHSDAVSLPQRSSRRRPGAANAHSSRTDPPVSDDNTHSRSLPRRTSRLRGPGVAAAHPPEPSRNSRVRRARRAGAAASAADPDPDPPVDPTSEPSSRLRRNSLLRRSRRAGPAPAPAAAADPDPEPPVSDDDGDSDDEDDEDPTWGSEDDGDSDDEDSSWGSEDDGSPPRSNSRLRRSRRLGPSASAAHRDRQPPVSDDDSCSEDDDPTDSLQGRNSRFRTSEPPMNRRGRRHSRSLGATTTAAATANPVPQISENSEFPNSDEWDAIEGLLALSRLPPKNKSSKKLENPEKKINDQPNDVHASSNADWRGLKHAFNGKSVHSLSNEINSKEDESFKVPAADADWTVKKTRSGDARIQQMIKLEFDKVSSKLNELYEDIKEIKQILLTRNSEENRNMKLRGNVAGSD